MEIFAVTTMQTYSKNLLPTFTQRQTERGKITYVNMFMLTVSLG